jgi:hypothetical protein
VRTKPAAQPVVETVIDLAAWRRMILEARLGEYFSPRARGPRERA